MTAAVTAAEDVERLLADLAGRLPAGPAGGGPAPTSAALATPIVFIEPE